MQRIGAEVKMIPADLSMAKAGIVVLTTALLVLLTSCVAPPVAGPNCAFGDFTDEMRGKPVVSSSIAIGHLLEDDVPMGPEDFAVMRAEGDGRWRLFVSVTDRTDKKSKGQIRTVIFNEHKGFEEESIQNLMPPKFEGVFHPVGMSLVRTANGHDLYIINNRDKAHGGVSSDLNRIEKFRVVDNGRKLTEHESLEGESLLGPNDVLVTEDGSLYVSNPWTPFVDSLGDYWNWPSLVTLRVNKRKGQALRDQRHKRTKKSEFVTVDRHMSFANGMVLPRPDQLLAADFSRGTIKVFQRNPTDGLLEGLFEIDVVDSVYKQDVSGAPDNLMLSENGSKVYIAAHKSKWLTAPHLFFGKERAPSAIFELDAHPEKETRPKLILDDGGEHMQAASTAMMLGKHLIVSQLKQPELFAFACKQPSAVDKEDS